jgi:iron complex transport system ATP-binding protein
LDGQVGPDRPDIRSDVRPDVHPDVVVAMDGVSVRRGATDLLVDLTWRVELDERWVVLGPNGAGKTTLLALAGARMHPSGGVVHLLGERLGAVDVFELRPRIGLSTPTLAGRIPPGEAVTDVVRTAAYAVVGRFTERYERPDDARAADLLDALGIAHLGRRPYGTLSDGERQRAQIARALMTDPELLLLDEPAAGLDDAESLALTEAIARLREELKCGVLLVEHDMRIIFRVCEQIQVLDYGKSIAFGSPEEIRSDRRVIAAYLGAKGAEIAAAQ